MIRSTVSTGNTMLNTAWTCSTEGNTITLPPSDISRDFCVCKFVPDYCELAFYNLDDINDEYTNDYHLEYITLKTNTSTYEFLLIDESGTEITIDSSLATIYGLGFNSDQPLMVGFNLPWWKVANTYGIGKYKIKINQTNLSQVSTSTSHYYHVVPFVQDRANDTVKIQILLEGLTMNGRNWLGITDNKEMYRVSGRLGVPQPQKEIEDDRLLTSGRSRKDNQTTQYNNYNLIVQDIPSNIFTFLMEEGTVMDWFITDYNVLNKIDYRNKHLLADGVTVGDDNPDYPRQSYEVSLTDKNIKLNRRFV
jgi:hypothetical protein